ncbi:MAG: hypothetical protein IIX40_06150 [Alistipes sp.]|nr:hypothetical protein [Alistipes sp.]
MWRKIGEIVASLVAMAVVIAYLYYASMLTTQVRKEQSVTEVVISFDKGSEKHRFATEEKIRRQIAQGGFKVEGNNIDRTDVVGIAQLIAKNSYVKDVDVYTTCTGRLYVDIEQHTPVLRLLSGGYNCYITAEGEVFRSPNGAACHTPVVTGSFRPMFKADFEGSIAGYYAKLIASEDKDVALLNKQISESKHNYRSCVERIRQLGKSRRRRFLEDDESLKLRRVGIDKEIKVEENNLAKLRAELRQLQGKKQRVLQRKARLMKSCNDILCLVSFVDQIGQDSYWNEEITQFDIRSNSLGEISMRMLPRSGDFAIEFGTLSERDVKLAKLRKFYDKGLSHIGHSYYKSIDVRFDKQVICTK